MANSQQQDCNPEEVIEEPDNSLLLYTNGEEESERDSESSVFHQRPFITNSNQLIHRFMYYQQRFRFEGMRFREIPPEYAGVRFELFRRFWGQSRDSNQEYFSYTWILVYYLNRLLRRQQQQLTTNASWNGLHQLHPPNNECMVRNSFPPSGAQALGVRSLLQHRTPWQYLQELQFLNYWDNFLLLYLRNTACDIGRNLSRIAIDFDNSPRRREMQEAVYSVRLEDLTPSHFGEILSRFVQENESIPHAVVVAIFLGCDLTIRALVENFVLFLPAPFRPYVIGRLNNWLRDHGGLIGAFNYLRNRPYGTAIFGIGMFAIFIFRHYRTN